ncbi:hypothetical protein SMAC4_09394 [Sordaria macrospora]|uniref:uncharacterized protein n=1 Tax=Sordaria macrospora TaxID=5147 RepID=UPI002B2BBDA1|nr:hypothetical protein SMAC4_09394 [Sordaria macrospora]
MSQPSVILTVYHVIRLDATFHDKATFDPSVAASQEHHRRRVSRTSSPPRLKDSITIAIMDQHQSDVIREHPIGTGLDAFRASFELVCKDRGISCPTPDALSQLGKKDSWA